MEMIMILLICGIVQPLAWASVVEVRPGQNLTLFCDCSLELGTLIVWFRNASHANQTSVLKVKKSYSPGMTELMSPQPRFHFVKNHSSKSYDLKITNVSESDQGLYFCATETRKLREINNAISPTDVFTFGNATTRVQLKSAVTTDMNMSKPNPKDCDICWTLLYSLCPTLALLSCLITLCVRCYQKNKRSTVDTKLNEESNGEMDEDVCYATLEIHQTSQRPKKTGSSADFCTYSAVKTSRA
ncbi:hypothetical protein NL108_005075 [Boleophthalmus pectinirostris]|nr:hypothetical protein NL108_005075 [Boleophthalmus pectinirostris]